MSGTDIRYAATASHDCEVVLLYTLHFSAMADYEGDDMDSQLLCDEIALLELYVPFPFIIHSKRVRVEIQDPFNTYFLLSCYIDHFTKSTHCSYPLHS